MNRLLRFCLENKLIVGLFVLFTIAWGLLVAPFDWKFTNIQRDPVPVDAIPDIGENQQIVFTKWDGRSPQDVEDQITYPLTVALLGIPGVKTIRSSSLFGFSSIFVIFKEGVEFYWSRTRILEKLNSLAAGTLPEGVQPALGPDATALGQVFWYTLEGRDSNGKATGGWDLDELRTIQDWYVRYALASVEGVSEVASAGGFVREYQIDVDPDAMRASRVTLEQVFRAVKSSNIDVGARTIELNSVEYVIRGIGFLRSVKDLERTVVTVNNNVPIYLENVAKVGIGPALRRGALDKGGAEAVGGVVVVRYGANPLAVIERLKKKIEEIAPGLAKKTLPGGSVSQVTIVPFYDRSGLIHETLGTLNTALTEEILVTVIVVLIMVLHLRSSLLISSMLPLAVLACFIAMKQFGVDANVVALSGIAIAIGTIVDMGVVLTENVLKHLDDADPGESRLEVVLRGASEVGSAVLTAVLTTVVSFLPVFTMEAAEGKLFKPLAFTKTFALIASVVIALTVLPALIHLTIARKHTSPRQTRSWIGWPFVAAGIVLIFFAPWWAASLVVAIGAFHIVKPGLPEGVTKWSTIALNLVAALVVAAFLAQHWLPLGPEKGLRNVVFVVALIGGLLLVFRLFQLAYEPILRFCLRYKALFLTVPLLLVTWGAVIWLGFDRMAPAVFWVLTCVASMLFLPTVVRGVSAWRRPRRGGATALGVLLVLPWLAAVYGAWHVLPLGSKDFGKSAFHVAARHSFPGLGKEFMPSLDEGSFLLMPVTQAHASIGEAMDVLSKQDLMIGGIPEVESAVGKIGRVDSPLDPAPISMIETVINYKPEYRIDASGKRIRYRYDTQNDAFVRDEAGELIPDEDGRPFRQWRSHIKSPRDIWDEIAKAATIPGTTSASELQPIAARIVMLATGMRSPLGIKVKGSDLATIERVGLDIERLLKQVPSVRANTVFADRVVGKPYIEIEIDREKAARYGIPIRRVQDVIEVAIGGKRLTTTVEGRERYPVRVRYQRELRDQVESIGRILVPGASGTQIPLEQLTTILYRPGPQVIKSEDTFLVSYVIFDKKPEYAEVDVVEACQQFLADKIRAGDLEIPAGVSYRFAGSYENQLRSEARLRIVLPLALFIIFMILYAQFRSVSTSLLVFSGVFVAWAGGFQMLWLYEQSWFLDFSIFGVEMRELFQVRGFSLSVAVWVGFLALFGIATDDGVVMSTYLRQVFGRNRPASVQAIREATVEAGNKRVRPCLMTTATTTLALIPVLTSTGKGSDIMVPMAIPSFGGMTIALITMFVVPTLYCGIEECRHLWGQRRDP